MNPSKDLVGSKYLQSPNNYQKQQESTTKVTAKQILSQVPTKNLRNPDYYITSILNNPNAKKIDLTSQVITSSPKKGGNDDFQKYRKEFEASIFENLKRDNGGNVKPEDYKAEMDKFQKNYEEFFRGYTPDVNSFKSYDNIKNNMNTQSSEKPAVDQMNNDPEFQKNMKKFYGEEGLPEPINQNKSSPFQTNYSKIIASPSKKETEMVKNIQSCKFNPITGQYN